MQQYVARPNRGVSCNAGVGESSGTLTFAMDYHASDTHGSILDFVTSSNVFLRETYFGSESVGVLQQRHGVASAGGPPHMWPLGPALDLGSWDAAGNQVGNIIVRATNTVSASDVSGGVLLAGDIAYGSPYDTSVPYQHRAQMWTGGGQAFSLRWNQPLASPGPVFGAGVDALGRSLVITGGATSGTITAQWFDGTGSALTGEFTLVTGFVPQAQTWFETSSLIGGGLEVRRMDYDKSVGIVSHALVVVTSGMADVHAPPQWMIDRPNRRLQIARGGRAYAVLPLGTGGLDAVNFPCTQTLEIVAPDGTSCGARDYPIAAGNCQTLDMTLGEDGTVMQQLSPTMESLSPSGGSVGAHTCTWRFWTRAVQ